MVMSMDAADDHGICSQIDVCSGDSSIMSGIRNQESADEDLNEDEQSKASIQTIVVKHQQQQQIQEKPQKQLAAKPIRASTTMADPQQQQKQHNMVVSRESSTDEEHKFMMKVEEDEEESLKSKQGSLTLEVSPSEQRLLGEETRSNLEQKSNTIIIRPVSDTSGRKGDVKDDPVVATMREIVEGSSSRFELEEQERQCIHHHSQHQSKSSSGDSLNNKPENNSKASDDSRTLQQQQHPKRSRHVRSHCSRHPHHHHHHHHHRQSIGMTTTQSTGHHHHHHHNKHPILSSNGHHQHSSHHHSRHHHHHHHQQQHSQQQHPTQASGKVMSESVSSDNGKQSLTQRPLVGINEDQMQKIVESSNRSSQTTDYIPKQQQQQKFARDSNSSTSSVSSSAIVVTPASTAVNPRTDLSDSTDNKQVDKVDVNEENLDSKETDHLTQTETRCTHHHSSNEHPHHHHHHHQHHSRQHSSTNIQHGPHHHHHHGHYHAHHGRHHHQNHKKRLVLDASVSSQQRQNVEDTSLLETTKEGNTAVELDDDQTVKPRGPLQEIGTGHNYCCPYHERPSVCQHLASEHSKHHHQHHHHHHHHHQQQETNLDQKKDTTESAIAIDQQSSSTRGHHHRHHHHHHGHYHGVEGVKQRHARVKPKNSSNTNLSEQVHTSVNQQYHHQHHAHQHHRQQEQIEKDVYNEKDSSEGKQNVEAASTQDKADSAINSSNLNLGELASKNEHGKYDQLDSENKMNLDHDDEEFRPTIGMDLHQQDKANDEVVRMDMSPNNDGINRLMEENETVSSKHGHQKSTVEAKDMTTSIKLEVKRDGVCVEPYPELSDKAEVNQLKAADDKFQQHEVGAQQVQDSDASGIGGGGGNPAASNKQSSYEFSRNQEGDSMRGARNKPQDSFVRQMSSSRENSQKDTSGGGNRQEQMIECSPIQSDSYQQQQQVIQPKQIIESTVPPDKRCRLCWCCCCPCSGLSNKSTAVKSEVKSIAEVPAITTNKCPSMPNVPLEEIRMWGESFDRLMKCPDGRKIFQDFLRCEYSEENILFWIACEELKSEKDAKSVATRARDIYEDYISILSAKEVSLDSRVRDVINNNIKKPTSNIFDEAQLQIYTLMHRDSYPRFINSSMYKKLAQIQTTSRKGQKIFANLILNKVL